MAEQEQRVPPGPVKTAEEALKYAKRQFWLTLILGITKLTAVVLGLSLTAYFGIRTVRLTGADIGTKVEQVREDVVQADRSFRQSQLRILSPVSGASVSENEAISGRSPYWALNNYVVVFSLKAKTYFVQDGPLNVSPAGAWSGSATFGGAQAGASEEYLVYCVASEKPLPLGPLPLERFPKNAIWSEPIDVTRK